MIMYACFIDAYDKVLADSCVSIWQYWLHAWEKVFHAHNHAHGQAAQLFFLKEQLENALGWPAMAEMEAWTNSWPNNTQCGQ